jgi:hypothetical protein
MCLCHTIVGVDGIGDEFEFLQGGFLFDGTIFLVEFFFLNASCF